MSTLAGVVYLVATALFIFGVKNHSNVRTAQKGNQLAALGMLVAVVTTLVAYSGLDWTIVIAGLVVGGGIGGIYAKKVEMTGMPELVALFNGFGGLASVLVAMSDYWGQYLDKADSAISVASSMPFIPDDSPALGWPIWSFAVILSVLIGSVTFTGSLVAMGKLSGKIAGKPIILPGRHFILGALFLIVLGASWYACFNGMGSDGASGLIALAAVAGLIGILAVIPIGGADMPVVVSLLNSYSGIAASMAGFVIGNALLITAGALVGAAGLILTMIMCKAMNRSLGNVLIGGFGDAEVSEDARDYTNVKQASPEEAAMVLEAASRVIFIPGYGMAVAQAQHVVKELGQVMEKMGAEVSYGIHPVAGRMPGHMNVLLAEADVPYEQLLELEKINGDFKNTDVTVIIGANDVVNPEAIENPKSPIAGMPILNAHESGTVLMIKRSLSPGYAGIKNPLFERDNTLMCFGDGKEFLVGVLEELKEL